MHNFKQYLVRNYNRHPNSELIDYLKLIYQSEFAGGHMIKSKESSLSFINDEIKISNNKNEELYNYISSNIVRINLSAYKALSLKIDLLNDLFYNSNKLSFSNKNINEKVCILSNLKNNQLIKINDYSLEKLIEFRDNPIPTHHSSIYNKLYQPHYRVIDTSLLPLFFRILKFQNFIDNLPNDKLTIIAVEGRCASGKSTITNKLKNVTIIHADDFFSKTDLLDFDSLNAVLSKIKMNQKLEYTTYNCMTNTYHTKIIDMVEPVVIVEGVYSYHQKIRHNFHKLVYIETTKELQMKYLKERTKDIKLYNKFISLWIPREEEYFNNNNLIELSNVII